MKLNSLKNFLYYVLTALYWGGFTFYAGFVVPTGMKVLGNHTLMGFITKEVAIYLNIIGLFWVISSLVATSKRKVWLSLSVLFSLIVLQLLHSKLSSMMDNDSHLLISSNNFYFIHRIYLIFSTINWLLVGIHFYNYQKE